MIAISTGLLHFQGRFNIRFFNCGMGVGQGNKKTPQKGARNLYNSILPLVAIKSAPISIWPPASRTSRSPAAISA